MTSETLFSSQYTSVWRTLTPSLEEFVRRRNMDGYERQWTPIPSTDAAADRRGVINEAGFLLFKKAANLPRSEAGPAIQAGIDDAFRDAFVYATGGEAEQAPVVTVPEKREAVVIGGRLFNFFAPKRASQELTVAPTFKGNGIISSCVGDVLLDDDQLWEVKSGDRAFRSLDYRQLAVYSALKYAASGIPFDVIALVNPRRGTWVEVSFDEFAREVSGQSAVTLCQSLIEAFSIRLASL